MVEIASSGTLSVCHHKREVRSGGLIKSMLPDVSLAKISLFYHFCIFVIQFLYSLVFLCVFVFSASPGAMKVMLDTPVFKHHTFCYFDIFRALFAAGRKLGHVECPSRGTSCLTCCAWRWPF